MLKQIKGLHHVTAIANGAQANNDFFTRALGLRRVKKTVNFDAPDVYHLYYGDEGGTPGSVMTYFPFPDAAPGRKGVGEVGATAFSVPRGSLGSWQTRLAEHHVRQDGIGTRFGDRVLPFYGPDGDEFALVEQADDTRRGWTGNGVGADLAIHGFHSANLRLAEVDATAELLGFMGYEEIERDGTVRRMAVPGGVANVIDLEAVPGAPRAAQGAGSVHHIAFAVENRARQMEVREALLDTGYQVTPVIDRDYFWSIYFRTPGGVLFEVATNEPGFERDEPRKQLGRALKLPSQHAHLRERIERLLEPLEG